MSDANATATDSSSPSTNEGEPSGGVGDNNKGSPLWKFVTILVRSNKGEGGNCTFKCHFCNGTFNGSHYRVRLNLLKISGKGIRICRSIPNEKKRELEGLVEAYEADKQRGQPRRVPLPSSSIEGSSSGSTFGLDLMNEVVEVPKKRKGVSGPLEKAFTNNAREQLDGEITRMFYTGGLSSNLAKNPHYIRSYNRAASCPIGGYRPPGYNALRTTLLHKERMHIEKMLEPIKLSWQQKGVSVCSDG